MDGPKITVHKRHFGRAKITVHNRNFGRSKLRSTTVILDGPKLRSTIVVLDSPKLQSTTVILDGPKLRSTTIILDGPKFRSTPIVLEGPKLRSTIVVWTVQNYVSQVVHWIIVQMDNPNLRLTGGPLDHRPNGRLSFVNLDRPNYAIWTKEPSSIKARMIQSDLSREPSLRRFHQTKAAPASPWTGLSSILLQCSQVWYSLKNCKTMT